MLINISNLGWFGDTWALRQHLQISRMRALETARPMIRSTNTGITAVIDPDAVVRALLPQGTVGVLDVEVQGYTGMTPYVRWGNLPILALSLVRSEEHTSELQSSGQIECRLMLEKQIQTN